MPTLAASCAQVVLRLATSIAEPSHRFQRIYSDIASRVKDGLRIEISSASKLIDAITRESQDPDIGLASYRLFKPAQLNSQLYAIMSSSCLREALKVTAHYSKLLADGTPITHVEQDGKLTVQFLRVESLEVSRQYIDCWMSTTLGIAHWLLPWDHPKPVSATFSYEEPSDRTMLESLYGENLEFSSGLNAITFSAADLARPLDTANTELKMFHLAHISAELSKRHCQISPIVRNIVFINLNAGMLASLDRTARELNLSSRTLQGRLEEESTCFKDIVDNCRREVACQLLSSSDDSIAVICEKLSFRATSSFHKACVRWFGCSPGNYRAACAQLRI